MLSIFRRWTLEWQIKVDDKHGEKIALIVIDGLLELQFVPFALCLAPATCQWLMDKAVAGSKWHTCLVSFDDVVCFQLQ